MSELPTLLAGLLALLAGGGAAFAYHRRQKRKLGELRDRVAVEQAKGQIDALRASREELEDLLPAKDKTIRFLDGEIQKNKRRIAEAHEGGEGLSDAEVDEELRRLGYL
jgi:uncharacterized protein HemX